MAVALAGIRGVRPRGLIEARRTNGSVSSLYLRSIRGVRPRGLIEATVADGTPDSVTLDLHPRGTPPRPH